MSKAGETFFTVVGCMDGRCQEAISKFGQEKFGAEYPDTITEAGLVGLLVQKPANQNLLDSIRKKINISLEKHHSRGVIVYGHQDCAGNPVSDERHKQDIIKTANIIRSLVPKNILVVPVFVKRNQEGWMAQEL